MCNELEQGLCVILLLACMQLCSTDCLVGVPNAMVSGREDMCAWS